MYLFAELNVSCLNNSLTVDISQWDISETFYLVHAELYHNWKMTCPSISNPEEGVDCCQIFYPKIFNFTTHLSRKMIDM